MGWKPSEHLLTEILRLTTSSLSSMSIQNLSQTIRGLALMRIKWDDLPDEFVNGAYPSILKNLEHGTVKKEEQQWFADMVHALGTLEAEWKMLPMNVRQAIGSAAVDVGPLDDSAMSDTLHGLAMMHAKWADNVDSLFKTAIINDLSRRALFSDSTSASGIAKTLWALGQMQVHHSELPMDLLLEHAASHRSSMTFSDAQLILSGLENLELSGKELSEELLVSIHSCVEQNSGQCELKVCL